MVNTGVDLHKTQFTVCVRWRGGEEFQRYPTTDAGYAAFLKEMAKWQNKGQKVRVGVESTGNTRYFKSQMEKAGIQVVVTNTSKLKVVNESVKKTDKHDAATIAEFLEKDMLPESQLCSRESEQIRRLLKARTTLVRTAVVIKNQIHALFNAEGVEDVKRGELQSKRGRQRVQNALNEWENRLVVQPLFDIIENLTKDIKGIEEQLENLLKEDRMVQLLLTIPGCGPICAWTIRAYIDDIKRFGSAKKLSAFAGLVPWVQNSNEVIKHGRITKRGPEELRTALVQVVMGFRRMQAKTSDWRLMQWYEEIKESKGSGKAIIATARKLAVIIWHMLSEDAEFDLDQMLDRKLLKKARAMRDCMTKSLANEALSVVAKNPGNAFPENKPETKLALPEEKKRKVG